MNIVDEIKKDKHEFSDEEYEAMFNFKKVCTTLADSDFLLAKDQLENQYAYLQTVDDIMTYRLFLNNFNLALYHYFFNFHKIKLHKLCFDNYCLLQTVFTYHQFKKTADKILHSYFLSSCTLKKSNSCISEIVHYIRNNLEKDFNLDDLGSLVNLNKCYLCSLFKTVTGVSLSQFINQERVKKAEILLVTSQMPIADISKQCGFRSTTYFSTVFRALNFMSPREYRIKIEESNNELI